MRRKANLGALAGAIVIVLWSGLAAQARHLRTLAPLCGDYPCVYGADPGPLLMTSAGDLYGTTAGGGLRGDGSVFRLTRKPGTNKWTFRTIYNFCALNDCADGYYPYQAGLVADSFGNLYGTANGGGAFGGGVFYKLTPNKNGRNWILTVLYNFCSRNSACTDGSSPQGPLTYSGAAQGLSYDSSSPLYGTTASYGVHNHGVVFSLTPKFGRWRETVLYAFCPGGGSCVDGTSPYGVTLAPDGDLVGVAGSGYPNNGLVFRLSPVEGRRLWSETVLHTFCSLANCADGSEPSGAPFVDSAGNIFGLTYVGGTDQCNGSGCGVLYELTPDGSETVLHAFCQRKKCSDGRVPNGILVADSLGTLYGATGAGGEYHDVNNGFGGGTVFKFSGSSFRTLVSFCAETSCTDGEDPFPGVALDPAGNLFGTTEEGGPDGSGIVYEIKR